MNVQNIPRDDKVVKRGIIPKLEALSFMDYANIEPRLFAYYTAKLGYPEMAKMVNDGQDPYTTVARLITGRDDVTKSERQSWKRVFLAILYGAGVKRVRETWLLETGEAVSQAAARKMLDRVKDNLPGFDELQATVIQTVSERGYVLGIDGRHLHQEPYGDYKMVNKLIQGSAAALMKAAIRRVHHLLEDKDVETHIISVVHDDLWFDGPESELRWLNEYIPRIMGNPEIEAVVPIEVEHMVSLTNAAEKIPYDEWRKAA